LKVLNLYAGIGGNRKLWEDVDVTAVEWDEATALVYSDYFPDDKMIVGDAHQYLLDHYDEFDFIWSSPPCPSHSRARFWGWQKKRPIYPDMSLYQEILLLDNTFSGKWIVENTVPYYRPLINGKQIGRHIFWSNFKLPNFDSIDGDIHQGSTKEFESLFNYDLSVYDIDAKKKKTMLRNCVSPETGLHILSAARNIITKSNTKQATLF
jgi:DNA (cytosine-5)-methyltransferase 1